MRLVMTLLCRDEVDIIANTIRFHLDHGVDHLIITDNGSVDGTLETLQGFLPSGKMTLIQEPRHDHNQAVWVTRMARMAATELNADWLIHGDADEFWWPACGNLKAELQCVPAEWDAVHIERRNFLPPPQRSDSAESAPFYKLQLIRERQSLNSQGLPLPGKVCHRAHPEAEVSDGNHSVSIAGEFVHAPLAKDIEILHFPTRSYDQFARKIRQGTEALMRNTRIAVEVGSTWRHVYEEYLQQGRLEDYYHKLQLCQQDRETLLSTGALIVDDRLFRALQRDR